MSMRRLIRRALERVAIALDQAHLPARSREHQRGRHACHPRTRHDDLTCVLHGISLSVGLRESAAARSMMHSARDSQEPSTFNESNADEQSAFTPSFATA